jgi:hypothetical protein
VRLLYTVPKRSMSQNRSVAQKTDNKIRVS